MRRRSRSSPHLAGGLLLSLVTIAFCLVVGEVLARILDPEASLWRYPNYIREVVRPPDLKQQIVYDAQLGWRPNAGVSGTLLDKVFSVSALGTRNHNLDAPPARGPTILALGDSFTEGFGVGNDETWPADLERLTGRRVLNAGVRGYGLDQMVLRAEEMVPKVKPQTMVLAFIADDIIRTALSVRDSMGKPYFIPVGERLELHNVPVRTTTQAPWLAHVRDILGYSRLLDFVMKRLGALELWYGNYVRTGADPAMVSCLLMERFGALSRSQHVEALVVALPQLTGWSDPASGAYEHKAASDLLSCAARAGLRTLDTFDAFEKEVPRRDEASLYTNYHLNVRGNELAARLIATALAASGG